MSDDKRLPAHIVSALNLIASWCAFEGEGATITITPSGHTLTPAGAMPPMEELAALKECYADRDRDLAYEFASREAAEKLADALDTVAAYASHVDGCPACASLAEPCSCGLTDSRREADVCRRAWAEAQRQIAPTARLLALGRACAAYEAARGTPGGAEARARYLAALEEVRRGEGSHD